jgi:hypothetical protein
LKEEIQKKEKLLEKVLNKALEKIKNEEGSIGGNPTVLYLPTS